MEEVTKVDIALITLASIDKRLDKLERKMDLTREEISGLKIKSGIWGAIAGIIPAGIGLAFWVMSL